MAKYTLLDNGSYKNNETGQTAIRPGVWLFEDVQKWLDEGNIPDPEFTDEQRAEMAKKDQIQQLDIQYRASLNQPAECVVGETTYQMDAKYDSAMRFQAAIDMAEIIGETELQMVDFHNKVHTITIETAKEIVKQQAIAFRTAYMTRAIQRDTLLNS